MIFRLSFDRSEGIDEDPHEKADEPIYRRAPESSPNKIGHPFVIPRSDSKIHVNERGAASDPHGERNGRVDAAPRPPDAHDYPKRILLLSLFSFILFEISMLLGLIIRFELDHEALSSAPVFVGVIINTVLLHHGYDYVQRGRA